LAVVVELTLGFGFGCSFFGLVVFSLLRGAAFFFFLLGPLLPLPITILIAPFQLV
jgi:hypothetical protein